MSRQWVNKISFSVFWDSKSPNKFKLSKEFKIRNQYLATSHRFCSEWSHHYISNCERMHRSCFRMHFPFNWINYDAHGKNLWKIKPLWFEWCNSTVVNIVWFVFLGALMITQPICLKVRLNSYPIMYLWVCIFYNKVVFLVAQISFLWSKVQLEGVQIFRSSFSCLMKIVKIIIQ